MDFKSRYACGCICFSEAEMMLFTNNTCVISTWYASATNFLPNLCCFYLNVAYSIHGYSIPCLTTVFDSRAERVNLLGCSPSGFTKSKAEWRINIISLTSLLYSHCTWSVNNNFWKSYTRILTTCSSLYPQQEYGNICAKSKLH